MLSRSTSADQPNRGRAKIRSLRPARAPLALHERCNDAARIFRGARTSKRRRTVRRHARIPHPTALVRLRWPVSIPYPSVSPVIDPRRPAAHPSRSALIPNRPQVAAENERASHDAHRELHRQVPQRRVLGRLHRVDVHVSPHAARVLFPSDPVRRVSPASGRRDEAASPSSFFSRRPMALTVLRPPRSPRYTNTKLTSEDLGNGKSAWTVEPVESKFQFKTDRRVPKLGCVPARGVVPVDTSFAFFAPPSRLSIRPISPRARSSLSPRPHPRPLPGSCWSVSAVTTAPP